MSWKEQLQEAWRNRVGFRQTLEQTGSLFRLGWEAIKESIRNGSISRGFSSAKTNREVSIKSSMLDDIISNRAYHNDVSAATDIEVSNTGHVTLFISDTLPDETRDDIYSYARARGWSVTRSV